MLKRLTRGSTHIVCENAQDVTATLCVVPSGEEEEGIEDREDFVNAQAIRARALCQVLANPAMLPVLADLYSRDADGTTVLLISAELYGISGSFSFKQVQDRVASFDDDETDTCIG